MSEWCGREEERGLRQRDAGEEEEGPSDLRPWLTRRTRAVPENCGGGPCACVGPPDGRNVLYNNTSCSEIMLTLRPDAPSSANDMR